MSGKELVCGVDKDVIERYLILIRDKYPLVSEASYFLETETGVSNISEITNIRDMLSHLVTILRNEFPLENHAQYATGEEHLRRAITEPYEKAVAHTGVKVVELYKEYKKYVIPIKDKYVIFSSAPNQISIEAKWSKIKELIVLGRRAKGENIWNKRWEDGIQSFIQAFIELRSLQLDLEGNLGKYHNLRRERNSKIYFWWAIATTIIMGILAIIHC